MILTKNDGTGIDISDHQDIFIFIAEVLEQQGFAFDNVWNEGFTIALTHELDGKELDPHILWEFPPHAPEPDGSPLSKQSILKEIATCMQSTLTDMENNLSNGSQLRLSSIGAADGTFVVINMVEQSNMKLALSDGTAVDVDPNPEFYLTVSEALATRGFAFDEVWSEGLKVYVSAKRNGKRLSPENVYELSPQIEEPDGSPLSKQSIIVQVTKAMQATLSDMENSIPDDVDLNFKSIAVLKGTNVVMDLELKQKTEVDNLLARQEPSFLKKIMGKV